MPASRSSGPTSTRQRTRISNACHSCRRKKIKCSGVQPCSACADSPNECIFDEEQKKVMVSEAYLQTLQSTAARLQEASSSRQASDTPPRRTEITPASLPTASPLRASYPEHGHVDDSAVGTVDESIPPVQNPLTSPDSFFLVDSSLKPRYLGSSSSTAYSWRVRALLNTYIGDRVSFNLIPDSEEQTYTMASAFVRNSVTSSQLAALPPLNTIQYLAETLLFHIGDLYHIFDRENFSIRLRNLYATGGHLRPLDQLWHVQLLLVIAFGKLFLGRSATQLGPPGALEFVHAMRVKQSIQDAWTDQILYLEILCLMALYLNTSDMRANAYVTIGEALRTALSLGMNREPVTGTLDDHEYRRRRRLWWTIYIIDKKLSVTVGTPLSIRNEDIDMSKPEDTDLGFLNAPLRLHVRLAAMDGDVISSAYRINRAVDGVFIRSIQDVFGSLLSIGEEFRGELSIDLGSTAGAVSRTAATLHIMYYQCTIISTRPLLLVLLKQRLTALTQHQPTRTISDSVTTLLRTCIGSASRIVDILTVLHQQELVEPFFPLDLQAVFSAGCILILTPIACPSIAVNQDYAAKCEGILTWMSSRGNVPAISRKRDLSEMRAAAEYIHSCASGDVPDLHPTAANWFWDPLNGSLVDLELDNAPFVGTDLSTDDAFWLSIVEEMGSAQAS